MFTSKLPGGPSDPTEFVRSRLLRPPDNFAFPFSPYPIQAEFMTHLFEVIESRGVGIFESPTGTGKSLSLMCGALKWLQDHEAAVREQLADDIRDLTLKIAKEEAATGGDWLTAQSGTIELKRKLVEFRRTEELVKKSDEEVRRRRERVKQVGIKSKWTGRNVTSSFHRRTSVDDLQDENAEQKNPEEQDDDKFIIEDIEDEDDPIDEDEDCAKYRPVQIFFCSRTHSQLSQVVNEIRNTVYGKDIQVATLASRQNYCINPTVQKLNSIALINERCLELQKNCSSKATHVEEGHTIKKRKHAAPTKCSYYAQNKIQSTRDVILTSLVDIEELISAATKKSACPYYASRLAAKDAHVVMLSYQMLLHRRTRLQNGLDLRDSIVIIDEGHNLIDTVSTVHSNEVTLDQLRRSHQQLVAYKERYFSRFSTKNVLNLNQLIFVTNRLIKVLENSQKLVADKPSNGNTSATSRMIRPLDLMTEGDFYTIRINELLDFCERTRLAQKVHGFSVKFSASEVTVQPPKPNRAEYLQKLSQKITSNNKKPVPVVVKENLVPPPKAVASNTSSAIRPMLAFLDSLTERTEDGRVLLTCSSGPRSKSSMKYVLLNPAEQFADVLSECRAVIVAGGTMQPTAELKTQLFCGQQERVQEYFFDHVVAQTSILPVAVSKGPTGVPFLFNYANRQNPDLFKDLQRTLCNVCNVTPAGVVCFFGSYDYLDSFCLFLTNHSLEGLASVSGKTLFREPRASNAVEQMLADYSLAAKNNEKGAILLSVVGGKLSEGLNFSDDLGRCVIVVGLPFPNKDSPELVEKMKFLDSKLGAGSGSEYYENICMKAVNQCIGRAVRHINDYAAVLLLDQRYAAKKDKLPLWISRSLVTAPSFGLCQGRLAKFFREKRT